jgi:hypothetical protein
VLRIGTLPAKDSRQASAHSSCCSARTAPTRRMMEVPSGKIPNVWDSGSHRDPLTGRCHSPCLQAMFPKAGDA